MLEKKKKKTEIVLPGLSSSCKVQVVSLFWSTCVGPSCFISCQIDVQKMTCHMSHPGLMVNPWLRRPMLPLFWACKIWVNYKVPFFGTAHESYSPPAGNVKSNFSQSCLIFGLVSHDQLEFLQAENDEYLVFQKEF